MQKVRHKLKSLGAILALLTFSSCESEKIEEPYVFKVPEKIKLHTSHDGGRTFPGKYEGVRIGEYYWMNSNFNHIEGYPIEQKDIDKILTIYRMNPSQFTVSIPNFKHYFGSYYAREQVDNSMSYARMYEGVGKIENRAWNLPTAADFQQLFAMCGDARIDAVIRYLSCKVNENPGAIVIHGSSWIHTANNNRYGFNMLPTGAIFNGPNNWTPHWGEGIVQSSAGDIYGLTQSVIYPAAGGITIKIDDYPNTSAGKLWHYMPIRWCRKLTDIELGYKLYINSTMSDIKKLSLLESAPSGYKELANGYLRGFYVQYILDKTDPEKTVPQIVAMTKGLR